MSYNEKEQAQKSKKPRMKRSLKMVIMIVSIIIVLFGGGFIVTNLYLSSNKTVTQPQETTSEKSYRVSTEIAKTNSDAEALADNGKIDEAAVVYDNEAKNTDDAYKKSILTAHKALLYFNYKQYDEALTIAKEAESIDVNITTVSILGNIYEAKGDKQKAIEYFKKTISYIDETQGSAEEEIETYQSRITALGGASN